MLRMRDNELGNQITKMATIWASINFCFILAIDEAVYSMEFSINREDYGRLDITKMKVNWQINNNLVGAVCEL